MLNTKVHTTTDISRPHTFTSEYQMTKTYSYSAWSKLVFGQICSVHFFQNETKMNIALLPLVNMLDGVLYKIYFFFDWKYLKPYKS